MTAKTFEEFWKKRGNLLICSCGGNKDLAEAMWLARQAEIDELKEEIINERRAAQDNRDWSLAYKDRAEKAEAEVLRLREALETIKSHKTGQHTPRCHCASCVAIAALDRKEDNENNMEEEE